MATWQQYDGIETRLSKVGAEIADFMDHLHKHFPELYAEHRDRIMGPAQILTDRLRDARSTARDQVTAERGHRR